MAVLAAGIAPGGDIAIPGPAAHAGRMCLRPTSARPVGQTPKPTGDDP
ncbi:MAG: hypothetical protein ABJP87_06840 [Bauldia litoralis]